MRHVKLSKMDIRLNSEMFSIISEKLLIRRKIIAEGPGEITQKISANRSSRLAGYLDNIYKYECLAV